MVVAQQAHKKTVRIYKTNINNKKDEINSSFLFPGNGFEPLLDDPESSVLPLDDPGIIL